MNPYHVSLALLAALSLTGTALTFHYVNGPDRLQRVIDGDTIIINHTTHVRIWGIDAPEIEQTCVRDNGALKVAWHCGKVSRDFLKSMLNLKVDLRCEKRGQDQYNRTIAICYTVNTAGQKHDIARSMVAAGWAVDYLDYSNGYYLAEQKYARTHKLGVWSGTFEMPWDWRKEQKR